ncbi:TPA: hypothetical protein ACH3X1_000723 [Trebouxia sp. C0004]
MLIAGGPRLTTDARIPVGDGTIPDSAMFKRAGRAAAALHAVPASSKEHHDKQDVSLPTWAGKLRGKKLGCFIIDVPMGLQGDTAWSLQQVIAVVKSIEQRCTPPYTIVLYSLYSMYDVQRALDEADP